MRGCVGLIVFASACSGGTLVGGGLPPELLEPVADQPRGYDGAGLAFDSARMKVVLFGGAHGGNLTGDTHELVDAEWVKVAESGPPARAFHAIAFDPRREQTVIFGGVCADGCCAPDTWGWDGVAWAKIGGPGDVPAARIGATMSWDARAEVLLLIGGSGCATDTRDLWAFDGVAWTRRWP